MRSGPSRSITRRILPAVLLLLQNSKSSVSAIASFGTWFIKPRLDVVRVSVVLCFSVCGNSCANVVSAVLY